MESVAVLDRVALRPGGPEISLEIPAKSVTAVLSPDGASAARLLRAIEAHERSYRTGEVFAPRTDFAPRMTVQAAVAKASEHSATSIEVSEALVHSGLANVRRELASAHAGPRLSLAQAIASPADLVLVPYSLDVATAWDSPSLLAALRRDRAVAFATVRLDLLEMADHVVVAHQDALAFAGTLDQLRRAVLPPTYKLVAKDASAARGLVESFRVSLTETDEGWVFRSDQGQAIAAKLLTHGYGRIEAVIERLPSLREALQAVIEHAEHGLPLGREGHPSGII